ncbi:MAG: hypothetical protein K0S93_52 [Nitrososphaeraceae archaeon]|jgi:hypothetical protein|nr:hypothetical protein [Nitrososphaeraceae archaeon]
MSYQLIINQEKTCNGDYREVKYKKSLITGLHYRLETPDKVIQVLDHAHKNDIRLRFYYGDILTGRDWEETSDIKGYVGSSTGKIKVPLVIYNTRTFGGMWLMDDQLVKIETTKGKNLLYIHPNYHKEKQQEN